LCCPTARSATASGWDEGEDELPAHVLALVIGGRRSRADVDQLGIGAAADAVLGEAERLIGPGGDADMVGPAAAILPLLPQFGEAGVPAGAGPLRAVEDLPVGGERNHLDAGQALLPQPVADQLGGAPIAFRAAHPVMEGKRLDRPLRRRAGDLGRDRPRMGRLQQGRIVRRPRARSGAKSQRKGQGAVDHALGLPGVTARE
jgi:hypothetical protein